MGKPGSKHVNGKWDLGGGGGGVVVSRLNFSNLAKPISKTSKSNRKPLHYPKKKVPHRYRARHIPRSIASTKVEAVAIRKKRQCIHHTNSLNALVKSLAS
jgi:hypothetical protein